MEDAEEWRLCIFTYTHASACTHMYLFPVGGSKRADWRNAFLNFSSLALIHLNTLSFPKSPPPGSYFFILPLSSPPVFSHLSHCHQSCASFYTSWSFWPALESKLLALGGKQTGEAWALIIILQDTGQQDFSLSAHQPRVEGAVFGNWGGYIEGGICLVPSQYCW